MSIGFEKNSFNQGYPFKTSIGDKRTEKHAKYLYFLKKFIFTKLFFAKFLKFFDELHEQIGVLWQFLYTNDNTYSSKYLALLRKNVKLSASTVTYSTCECYRM